MRTPRLIATVLFLAILVTALLIVRLEPPPAPEVGDVEHAWRLSDPLVRMTNRGIALMEQYEYGKAVIEFEEAYSVAPDSHETRVNLAIALYNRNHKGDLDRSEALLDDVIREDPEHLRALYFRAIAYQYRGNDESAMPLFERVVALAPHDASAWYLLGTTKAHLGQSGRDDFLRAVKEQPALVSAYYDLLQSAVRKGDTDEAKQYLDLFNTLRQSPLAEKVVMPNYNQMGPLATVRPVGGNVRRPIAGGELSCGPVRALFEGTALPAWRAFEADTPPGPMGETLANHGVAMAMADVNNDQRLDLITNAPMIDGRRGLQLLLATEAGGFTDATSDAGLGHIRGVVSVAFGDYDNDGYTDLSVARRGPNQLFRGLGKGRFEDVTEATGTAGADVLSMSAVFLDADHDADLDIYVCNAVAGDGTSPAANQLLNNNMDGTFTDIAAEAGVACAGAQSVMVAPADLDGDRDTDLIVFNRESPAQVFFNDRLGKYHAETITDHPIHGPNGGLLQDFNGDGRVDLLLLPSSSSPGRLYLTDGAGRLSASTQFDDSLASAASWEALRTARVADVDLDGDLDVALFGTRGHLLLNDGSGRFVALGQLWPATDSGEVIGTELSDADGNGAPDLWRAVAGEHARLEVVPTMITPPPNWLALTPTGDRADDKSTRSPNSGFGTRIEARCGIHSQTVVYSGLDGGLSQSRRPLIFGLNGASKADYVALFWPDGVTQAETELTAGAYHQLRELQRRLSSCPVLFAWNGRHFTFVGDFAGVGGLGYFSAPGAYADPQPIDHIKIEADQLVPRDGYYELRMAEPMEEVGYMDRVVLLAVDHPADMEVYPDERLAVTGPPPSRRLLCTTDPVFPAAASGPDGPVDAHRLVEKDRVYAYEPERDRRFVGFCKPHTLELDFADRLAPFADEDSVYLFLTCSIEYPYSQTTYAASQAKVEWRALMIERQAADGAWETIIPDAGAPGGMGRTIAADLSGLLPAGTRKLRIVTNLEIYYDRAYIAADRGTANVSVRTVPLVDAKLRRLGFPLEYSPDGRHPYIYSYDVIEPTSSFKMPRGAYTRYGDVADLLAEFDDRYVILGTGDEIAVRFDATALPPPPDGSTRSFVLVSHAYCKDMDLYTAAPDTVEPLPFRGMSRYPYPSEVAFPDSEPLRIWRQRYNSRWIE